MLRAENIPTPQIRRDTTQKTRRDKARVEKTSEMEEREQVQESFTRSWLGRKPPTDVVLRD